MSTILRVWLRFPTDVEDSYTSLPCTTETRGSDLASALLSSVKKKRGIPIFIGGPEATNTLGLANVWQIVGKTSLKILELNEPVWTQLQAMHEKEVRLELAPDQLPRHSEAPMKSAANSPGASSSSSSAASSSSFTPSKETFTVGQCLHAEEGNHWCPAQAFVTYLVASGQLPLSEGRTFSRRLFEEEVMSLAECIEGFAEGDREALKASIGETRLNVVMNTVENVKAGQIPDELKAFLKPVKRGKGRRVRSLVISEEDTILATMHEQERQRLRNGSVSMNHGEGGQMNGSMSTNGNNITHNSSIPEEGTTLTKQKSRSGPSLSITTPRSPSNMVLPPAPLPPTHTSTPSDTEGEEGDDGEFDFDEEPMSPPPPPPPSNSSSSSSTLPAPTASSQVPLSAIDESDYAYSTLTSIDSASRSNSNSPFHTRARTSRATAVTSPPPSLTVAYEKAVAQERAAAMNAALMKEQQHQQQQQQQHSTNSASNSTSNSVQNTPNSTVSMLITTSPSPITSARVSASSASAPPMHRTAPSATIVSSSSFVTTASATSSSSSETTSAATSPVNASTKHFNQEVNGKEGHEHTNSNGGHTSMIIPTPLTSTSPPPHTSTPTATGTPLATSVSFNSTATTNASTSSSTATSPTATTTTTIHSQVPPNMTAAGTPPPPTKFISSAPSIGKGASAATVGMSGIGLGLTASASASGIGLYSGLATNGGAASQITSPRAVPLTRPVSGPASFFPALNNGMMAGSNVASIASPIARPMMNTFVSVPNMLHVSPPVSPPISPPIEISVANNTSTTHVPPPPNHPAMTPSPSPAMSTEEHDGTGDSALFQQTSINGGEQEISDSGDHPEPPTPISSTSSSSMNIPPPTEEAPAAPTPSSQQHPQSLLFRKDSTPPTPTNINGISPTRSALQVRGNRYGPTSDEQHSPHSGLSRTPSSKTGTLTEVLVESGVVVERVQEFTNVAYDVIKINERGRRQQRVLRLTSKQIQNVKDADNISSRHSYDEVLCVTLTDHETLVISYIDSHDYTYVSPIALQIVNDINERISRKRELRKIALSQNLDAISLKFQEKLYRMSIKLGAGGVLMNKRGSGLVNGTGPSVIDEMSVNDDQIGSPTSYASTITPATATSTSSLSSTVGVSFSSTSSSPYVSSCVVPPASRSPPPLPGAPPTRLPPTPTSAAGTGNTNTNSNPTSPTITSTSAPSKSTMKLQQLFGSTHEQRVQTAIDLMILESTSDAGRARARFIKNFDTLEKSPKSLLEVVRRFMDSLRHYVITKRMDDIRRITGYSATPTQADEDELLKRVEQSVESATVQPLYIRLMLCLRKQVTAQDDLLSTQLTHLRTRIGCDQSFYGISNEYHNVNNWSVAIEELNDLDRKFLPCEKLTVLMNTARAIYNTFNYDRQTRAKLAGHTPTSTHYLSADLFLPIFVFVLSQSSLQYLETTKIFIWGLGDKSALNSEAGYFCTVFESALEVLKTMETVRKDGEKDSDSPALALPSSASSSPSSPIPIAKK